MIIINKFKVNAAQKEADKIIRDAKKEAEKAKRDGILELKEESYKLKNQTDAEIKEKKKELNELNQRIETREKSLDKRDELLAQREKNLEKKDKDLEDKQKEIQEKDAKMESIIKEQIALLEKISGFSKEKARDLVMKKVEEEMNMEISMYLKDREDQAKLEADKKAREILVSSMQRYSNDVTNEQYGFEMSLSASAIREKNGENTLYKPSQMADAIRNLNSCNVKNGKTIKLNNNSAHLYFMRASIFKLVEKIEN